MSNHKLTTYVLMGMYVCYDILSMKRAFMLYSYMNSEFPDQSVHYVFLTHTHTSVCQYIFLYPLVVSIQLKALIRMP